MKKIFRRKKQENKKPVTEAGHYNYVPASVKRGYFISGVVITLMVVALFYFLFMINPIVDGATKPDTIQTIKKAKEIQRLIDHYYLFDIDEQEQTEYMFVGQVAALGDKYSAYYTAEEYSQMMESIEGEYLGIGVTIAQRAEDGEMLIVSITEDGPADKAGVMDNDIIREVNGEEVNGMTSSEVSTLIRSDEDETVDLLLYRESEDKEIELSVPLAEIEQNTVRSRMLDGKIGYLQITQFAGVTEAQYKAALEELQDDGMEKLIIDLRDNPGGLVDSACNILSTILPEGNLVYQEDKEGKRTYKYNDDGDTLGVPLVVLVNENSASASEIFTGAIKDYEAGTIIGEQTYGKGIVQNYFRLSDGSAVRLTVTKYFTPNGNDIHEKGITPDIVVENPEKSEDAESETESENSDGDDSIETENDLQLQKAIEVLKKE